jgi:hypothetical protein
MGSWKVNRYPSEPDVFREDAEALRRLAHTMAPHPEVGAAVSLDYLENLAGRIERMLENRTADGASPA